MTDYSVYTGALSLRTFIIPTFNARQLMLYGAKLVLCGSCKMVSRKITSINTLKHSGQCVYHSLGRQQIRHLAHRVCSCVSYDSDNK
jgi:hypothetical protein